MKEKMEILIEILNEKKEVKNVTLEAKSFDDMKAQLQEKGWELRKYRLDKSWEQRQIQPFLDTASAVMMIFGAALFGAIVFSFPFPFVRRLWIKELWGFYGLLNAAAYIALGYGIRKKILESAFIGFGILIFDQWITWKSFLHFTSHVSTHGDWFYFLLVSVFLSGGLAMLLGQSAYKIYHYLRVKQNYKPKEITGNQVLYWFQACLGLLAPCFFIWLGIQKGIALSPKVSYACLRVLGLIASLITLGFAGHGLKLYVKTRSSLWLLLILMSFSALIFLNYTIMSLLPFSSVAA